VTETEFSVSLSRSSFAPGTVLFVTHNTGTKTHALGVQGPGVDTTTDDIAPGGSATLTVTLVKGSYDLYCPVGNHKMLGMDVHVTVS
jgi:plastocyanin